MKYAEALAEIARQRQEDRHEVNHADDALVVNATDLIAELKRCYEEIDRVRSIAEDLHAYIVSDADISLSIAEKQMDWVDASE